MSSSIPLLARALAPLVGTSEDAARRFFVGYGAANGARWRDFLTRLDRLSGDEAAEREAIEGARAAFADFEDWMSGAGAAASQPNAAPEPLRVAG